jgi:hypothetical protein
MNKETRLAKLEAVTRPFRIVFAKGWKKGDPQPWLDLPGPTIVLPGDFSCNRDSNGNPIDHDGRPLC